MKIVFLRYLLFLTIFLPISCSTVKSPVVNDTGKLIPAPYYKTSIVLNKNNATNIVSLINQDKDSIPVQGLISASGRKRLTHMLRTQQ